VHLNFGKVEGMPLPELRCKLPQAVANMERAQFWSQVLQIPGMSVVKTELYDSLGIAMPGEGDEVLEAPTQQDNGLAGLLQGAGIGKEEKPERDEVALAARASTRKVDGLTRALPAWREPIKKKLIEARKAGATLAELREQMLEWHPNTQALADAFAENVEAGLRGEQSEEIEAQCNQHEHDAGCDNANLPHPSEWKPIIMPDKMSAEEARAELAKGIKVTNPLGEEITLDNHIINHWQRENKTQEDINRRLAALPLIKEVVKNPAEIWEKEDESRTYIAGFIDPYITGKKYAIAFTQAKDNTIIETYWANAEKVNKKRAGKLLFSKDTRSR
jgi:hypothetical protein